MSSPLAGADITTFFAPAVKCFEAPSLSLKIPVDSITTSTPKSFQGRLEGFLSLNTFNLLSPTKILSSPNFTSGNLP